MQGIVLPTRPDFTSVEDLGDQRLLRSKYCSIKLDGNFTYLCKDTFGSVIVLTRTKKDITDKVILNQFYMNFLAFWKGPIVLTGELWAKGVRCSSISTLLADRGKLQFWCFGVQGFTNQEKQYDYCMGRNIPHVRTIEGPFTAVSLHEYFAKMSQVFDPADGLVFHDGPGTEVFKWKPVKTIDLVLFSWRRGKGKYTDTLGKVLLKTAEGDDVASVSGMTDEERHWIKDNFKALKGRVVEVSYMGVGSKGRLRHPSFVRFRADKSPAGCSRAQDEELSRYWKNYVT